MTDPVHALYLDLTAAFNRGRTRAVLASGQAVVWHRLAITSKDGDWILREDAEAIAHVLAELARRGARYRFGAPLDLRWLAHGWSSHLEFALGPLRVRTDFVCRPPRLDAAALERLWLDADDTEPAVVGVSDLIALKKTNRERDYAVIGELARRLHDPPAILRESRSPRDLLALAAQRPDLLPAAQAARPALLALAHGEDALAAALDAERRQLIRRNEERLGRYLVAAAAWRAAWPDLERRVAGKDLAAAHALLVGEAQRLLPTAVPGGWP